MAVRESEASGLFAGGVARWVEADEAREIVSQVEACEGDQAALGDWFREKSDLAQELFPAATEIVYRARLRALQQAVDLTLARVLIVRLGLYRRRAALRSYAEDCRLTRDRREALEAHTARCETCGTEALAFYCDKHAANEIADVEALTVLVA